MDREQFSRYVREALAHLYDQTLLDTHPLGTLLAPDGESPAAGSLQQILVEAIQQLKPPHNSPQYLPRWRRYRHLYLRYLEGADLQVIAEQLSISERQVRRDHLDAIDALASMLWARYSRIKRSRDHNGAQATSTADGLALETEVRRMDSAGANRPVHLDEVVQSVLETVAHLMKMRQVALQVSLPDHLPPAAVDRVVLRQILLGLLVYAIDHDSSERVDLTAQDQGPHLSMCLAVHRSSVATVDGDPTSQTTQGPMVACRQLVELEGGTFQQCGAGSRYEQILITLPRASLTTVLVVDDNPDFIRLFQRYLADQAYRVIQTSIASEAVEIARAVHPDIITLDVMMPSQDGWETLQALKHTPETSRIPVLVCSVLRQPSLALALGATEFLAKPVTRQAWLAALERCARPVAPGGL